jgi:hypothetical protein
VRHLPEWITDSALSANLARFRRMTLNDPLIREGLIRWGFRFGFTLLGVLSVYGLARG